MPRKPKKRAEKKDGPDLGDTLDILLDRVKMKGSLDEFLEAIIDEWGGVEKIAEAMFNSFHTSKPGSMNQTRIIDSILRLLTSKQAREGDKDDELNYLEITQLRAMLHKELDASNTKRKYVRKILSEGK
jgi:hypothetical protein